MTATGTLRLVTLTGLTHRQISRLVGCTVRQVAEYCAGAEPSDQHRARVQRLLTAIEPLADAPDARRRALLASNGGRSLFHRLVAENPTDQVMHVPALTAREQLGV